MRNMTLIALSSLLMSLTACKSLYLEDFDSPVHEGVTNYSLTDLERSVVEMPGSQQDVLVIVPKIVSSKCSCIKTDLPHYSRKVWICHKKDCFEQGEEGHYKVFVEEETNELN